MAVVVAISSTPLISTTKTIRCAKRKKDLQHRQPRQFRPRKPSLPYPKSRPTPIILTPKPRPQTKLEALDAVVSDLESSLENGVDVECDVLASLLETCYKLGSVHHGVRIHHLIPDSALRRNVSLSSKLIRLYASRGLVQVAHEVFDRMPQRTRFAFAWNSLISGYAEQGQHEEALALYFQMEEEGIEPDEFTFPRVLKACGGIGSVGIGEAVHRSIVRLGFWDDPFVLNALVDMYAKCGDIVKAKKIFDKIGTRDLVSWNSILTGYVRHNLLAQALETFRRMIREGFEPDSVTVSTIISKITALKFGLEIHGWSIRRETQHSLSIANSLIVFYSNNGKLKLARHVFDGMPERDIVSWNSIISAHSKNPKALAYFDLMEGFPPDKITFVSLLSTCAHLGMVEEGKRLFYLMRKKYKIRPIMEHYGCMVNLFARVGMVGEAYRVVTKAMDFVEVGPTLWGALLYSCCLHGNVEIGEIAAEKLFDLEPDNEHNFELLMKIYGDANMTEGVERVRKMMVERGLV